MRCAKLAVLDVLGQTVRRGLVMPWGILTGVRPGKLAHKLLDSGLSCDELPQYLERHYLLPHGQAQLLTEICLRQRQLLPAAEKQVGIYIGIPFALRAVLIVLFHRELCRLRKNYSKSFKFH